MNRSRPSRSLVLLPVLALFLAACAGGGASPSEAATPAEPSMAPPSEAASMAPEESQPAASEAAPSEAGGGEEARVRLDGFAFDVEELTIAAGTEVTFLNVDSAAHTVTEGVDGEAAENPIIDEELAGNQATSFTFEEAGTYQITCLLHPSMNMTVVVEG